ncbi:MAG: PBECR2 nuclease fold domain-containing protein [Rhodospirillaceae bacterium]
MDETITLEGVPFGEAIEFLRQKLNLPSRAWTDIKERAHARSFVVAGAMKDRLLADIHGALVNALNDGTTLDGFRKAFDAITDRHGWTPKQNKRWRARVIYDTNLRMARAAGRAKQISRLAERERAAGRGLFLRYVAVRDDRTRPEHLAWDGLILPIDHPFWSTHSPPNGWFCRCTLEILTERQMRRMGYQVTPDDKIPAIRMEPRQVTLADGSSEVWDTPEGIDTGFGYSVGQAWLDGAVPPPLSGPLPTPSVPRKPLVVPPMPAPQPVSPQLQLLPDGLRDEDYIRAFLTPFGADIGQPRGVRDASGHMIAIDDSLFLDRAKTAKAQRLDPNAVVWKVGKHGRHRTLPFLAEALRDPDEIWLDWFKVKKRHVLRRRYLRRFEGAFQLTPSAPGGALELPVIGGLSVFEWTPVGWEGRTLFSSAMALEQQRVGALIYRRQE